MVVVKWPTMRRYINIHARELYMVYMYYTGSKMADNEALCQIFQSITLAQSKTRILSLLADVMVSCNDVHSLCVIQSRPSGARTSTCIIIRCGTLRQAMCM